MRLFGLIALAAAAAVLAGCNVVVTDAPMFKPADAAGAPALRPGVWVKPKAGCAFARTAKARDLPDCANPMIVHADVLIDPRSESGPVPYILAAGSPRVAQLVAKEKPLEGYFYGGVKPLRFDKQGHIIEARTWMAQCGPPPPDSKDSGEASDYLTRSPLPGMILDTRAAACKPVDKPALLRAVAASEHWADEPSVIRWLRDGDE